MAKLVDDKTLRVRNLSEIGIERIEPLDIMRLFRVVWYGKLLIAACTTLAILAGAYYAFGIAAPRFAAVTTLKITATNGSEMNIDPAAVGLGIDQSSLNTEVAVLRSRHLLNAVVDELDLTANPAFNRYLTPVASWSLTNMRTQVRNLLTGTVPAVPDEAAILDKTIDNLAATIRVNKLRDTYIFQITATTGDPAMSAQITDTLARLYLADQIAGKQAATETAFNWLSERVYDLQLELEAKETAVSEIVIANRANDAAVLDTLRRQSIEAQDRLLAARRALADARTRLRSMDTTLTPAAATNTPMRQGLQSDVARLTDQVIALEVFQASINAQLADQSASLVRLQQLRRETDATRVLYETFLARLQQTNVQRGLRQPDSRILASAAPGKYVAPRKMLILLIAAMLGAVAGLSLVLTRHALRKGFSDADDLAQATDLPVMAQIPRIAWPKRAGLLDYLNAKPASPMAEAMRSLRTSLLLADRGRVPQIILSTSSVAGEGKTTQSVALAHNLAGLRKSVLLIEADLRRPGITKHLQTKACDLGRVVAGRDDLADAITRDPRLPADVLAGGPIGQSPADLFSDPVFAAFLQKLRKQYDFIIIDAPPVLPVPDTRLLAQYADAVLYAVRWGKTDKSVVLSGQKALADVRVSITGLVLSQVDMRRMQRYGMTPTTDCGQPYFQS